MLLLQILYFFSFYFTFPPKFALDSSPRKQARWTWNFNRICTVVTTRGRLLLRQSDLFYWWVLGHIEHFVKRRAIRCSSKLFIALSQPGDDAMTFRNHPVTATAEISALKTRINVFGAESPHLQSRPEVSLIIFRTGEILTGSSLPKVLINKYRRF